MVPARSLFGAEGHGNNLGMLGEEASLLLGLL